MKTRRRFFMCAGLLGLVFIAVPIAILRQSERVPLTITSFHRSRDPAHLTIDVRNDAPGRVRVYAVHVHSRVGTNWALVGQFPLGYTNSTERSIHIEVDCPAAVWPRPWKASLVYMPQFQGTKLLRMRLEDAWKRKSLRQGFMLTGWEGSRQVYSEELTE